MRIVAISDTHGTFREVKIPEADVLVHAGDIFRTGRDVTELIDFNLWLADQPVRHRVVIAGNHDWLFYLPHTAPFARNLLTNATYLENSGAEIEGFRFWGSPIQPEFNGWAFNAKRGAEIRRYWDMIPPLTDVLVTHGPPRGRLDTIFPGSSRLGCEDLREVIALRPPQLHIFGHIHGGYGVDRDLTTHFINAALLDDAYRGGRDPIVFDLENPYA